MPLLRGVVSDGMAVVLCGMIWAGWHYPMILFGLLNAHLDIVQSMLVFSIETIVITGMMLLIKKKLQFAGVWPFIVYHTIHNICIECMAKEIDVSKQYLYGDSGLIFVGMILLGVVVVYKFKDVQLSATVDCTKK